MRVFVSILATALIAGGAIPAVQGGALPKANEYKSGDCSGPINYGHHSGLLTDVTMDDTSHSVYLSGTDWWGFSEKESDGGRCSGFPLTVNQGCQNLDIASPEHPYRIKCVRNKD